MLLFKNHLQEENSPIFEVHLVETPNLPSPYSDIQNQESPSVENDQSANNSNQMIQSDESEEMSNWLSEFLNQEDSVMITNLLVTDSQLIQSDILSSTSPSIAVETQSTNYLNQMIHSDVSSSTSPLITVEPQSINNFNQMIHCVVSSSMPSPPVPKEVKKDTRKRRRIRTQFSSEQLLNLHMEFEKNQYITGQRRFQLSQSLKLTEEQITVWFQNRRTRTKKKAQAKCPEVSRRAAKVPKESKSQDALAANRLLAYSVMGNQNNSNSSAVTSCLNENMPSSQDEDANWYLINFQSNLVDMLS